jgi:16S rRNA G966 N2-methylase RsmD
MKNIESTNKVNVTGLAPVFTSVLGNLARARLEIDKASENKDLKKLIEIKTNLQVTQLAAKNAEGLLLTSQESKEIVIKSQKLQMRAERAAGFVIPEKFPQGKPKGNNLLHLENYGLNRMDSSRMQRLAKIPEKEFEVLLDKSEGITRNALISASKEIEREIGRANPEPIPTPKNITITLINGDFQFADQAPNSIDAIITDPPYPKEFLGLWEILSMFGRRVLKPSKFLATYSGQLHLPTVIDKLSKHLDYFWTMALIHDSNSNLIQARGVFNRWRPVLIFNKPPMKKLGFDDILQGGGMDKSHHDWGQDVSEAARLIEIFSKPGDTIFEPFAGGGSTIEACIQTKRNCIAYEIDKKTYSILKKRFPDSQ